MFAGEFIFGIPSMAITASSICSAVTHGLHLELLVNNKKYQRLNLSDGRSSGSASLSSWGCKSEIQTFPFGKTSVYK